MDRGACVDGGGSYVMRMRMASTDTLRFDAFALLKTTCTPKSVAFASVGVVDGPPPIGIVQEDTYVASLVVSGPVTNVLGFGVTDKPACTRRNAAIDTDDATASPSISTSTSVIVSPVGIANPKSVATSGFEFSSGKDVPSDAVARELLLVAALLGLVHDAPVPPASTTLAGVNHAVVVAIRHLQHIDRIYIQRSGYQGNVWQNGHDASRTSRERGIHEEAVRCCRSRRSARAAGCRCICRSWQRHVPVPGRLREDHAVPGPVHLRPALTPQTPCARLASAWRAFLCP